jgi:ABC transport system ATP-binding/permease protein
LPAFAPPPASSANLADEAQASLAIADLADAPLAYKLTGMAGLLTGRTFSIEPSKGLMIGRDPANCQVVIPDDEISRLHAWVGFNKQNEILLQDRRSANGSYVNGQRIEKQALKTSDNISFGSSGRHVFRIEKTFLTAPPISLGRGTALPQAGSGQASLANMADLAAAEEEGQGREAKTVKIKLTDLVARPHLELIVDKYAVRTLDIPDGGLKVGRDASRCPMAIEHPSVSGVHAEFSFKDGRVALTDRSTNGTFVNGRRVTTADLHDGDYITFGRYAGKSLIFRTGLEPELKIEKVDLDKDRISIGREAGNDIVINHPTVSSMHAEIVKQDGKVLVVDLGSTNGTFVNGMKVKRHQLQELDRIVIGPTELHFSGGGLSRSPGTSVVRLDVENVTFQVADRATGKPKVLLDDISLVVKPRELIGLLGPSGAGKSTLMNALNGFVKPTAGQVLYNSADLYHNLESLKSTIGYVPQEDIMHKQLSVRRCLYYAAKLRLPEDLSEEEINRRVAEMLEILKLEPERWDNPVYTLSGGQRKRVSIGIELLPKPGVLFLDEPTAGLDPRTETLMMMLFRQLANQGSTIIITTHLLASFGVLDKAVVLVQGRLAFYGPGTKFLEYFKAEAPPDVYDDLTDNNTPAYALELKKRYAESSLHRELIEEPLKAVEEAKRTPGTAPPQKAGSREFSLHQFGVLVKRNWEQKFADRGQTLLLFAQAPVVALLVALMASAANQMQTIFMAMFASLWFGCSNAVREIVDEQVIYKRERQTGLKVPSYVFAKLFVLSFIALVQCVSVVAILLFVKGALDLTPAEILGAVAMMFLVAVNGTLIGLVISALVNSPEKALTLFPLILIPELLLSGLFLPVKPIQMLIPVTVDQLLGGQLYAQPEAVRKANSMIHPAEPPGSGDLKHSQTGSDVVAGIVPGPEAAQQFHRFTPAPVQGMPGMVRWLSVLAVSRWGLESLADLCLHGQHSMQESGFKIINTVSISLHPHDVERIEAGMKAPWNPNGWPGPAFPLASDFWPDKGPYLAILVGYALVMIAIVLVLVKRKDVA